MASDQAHFRTDTARTPEERRRSPSAFEVLEMLIAVIGLVMTGAELANRQWGVGVAPTEVVRDLIERVEPAPPPPPPVGGDIGAQMQDDLDELQDVMDNVIDREAPAAPSGLRITATDGCDLTLSWTGVGGDVATYNVVSSTGMRFRVDASQTVWHGDVFRGSTETFFVTARDEHLNTSEPSNAVSHSC